MEEKLIVVGIDGSETSIEALRDAAAYARMLGAAIRTITTWDYVAYDDVSGVFDPEREAQSAAEYAAHAVFGDTIPDSVAVETVFGRAPETLVRASEEAVLLVVGSRGHNAAVRFLLGSTSTYCAARAHCPVLIVHQHDRDASPAESVAAAVSAPREGGSS